MNFKLFLLTFVSSIAIALSAITTYRKPAGKPGDCWTTYTGPMQDGEEIRHIENECMSVDCYRSMASILTCGRIVRGDNRTTGIDYSKPYPECCPKPLGKVVAMVL